MTKAESGRIWSLEELIASGVVHLGRGKVISKLDLEVTPGSFPVYSSAKGGDGKFGEYGNYLFDEELITWSVDGGGHLFHRPKHKFSVTNVGGFLRILRPEYISYKYLYHALTLEHSKIGFDWVKKAHPSVIRKEYKKIHIPSPAEQARVVAILDEAFEGIDAAVANTKKNLANARELFESYLNSVFSQKGREWVRKRLDDIGENLDSRRVPVTKSKRVIGDIPYYGASGIVDYVSGHLFDEDILLISEDGANLLARTYPIAFSVSGKSWVNNHAHVVRFNHPKTQKIVELYLNSISLAPYVSGMAQPKLNQKSLNSIPVPVPPMAEQVRVVETAEALQASVERLEEVYREKLDALAELKQSILRKAFAGELTARSPNALREAAE